MPKSVSIFCSLIVLTIVSCQRKCPNISEYENKDSQNENWRLTSINDGDFIFLAMGTFTRSNTSCRKVSVTGLKRFFALKYAIDQANENETLTKYGKLGLQVDDICQSLPTTMARGIEVISLHRPNSVCRADFLRCALKKKNDTSVRVKPASAIIGTGMSFTTIPLASLMSLYSIPQVSYSASSRLLSKRDLYRSFFRTIPSDSNQIQVMIDIFERFKWNYIFAIGSDDDYGKLGINDLKQKVTSLKNICIYKDTYIPYKSVTTKNKIKAAVDEIEKETRAKAVVLFTYANDLGDLILKEARDRNISRVWLTSEAWNPAALKFTPDLSNQAHGILSVSLKVNELPHLEKYIEKEVRYNWECNMWLKNFIRNTFNCSITRFNETQMTFYGTKKVGGDPCSLRYHEIIDKLSVASRDDDVIDAVTALAHALSKAMNKGCNNKLNCTYKPKTSEVTEQMYNVTFINHENQFVSFDKSGDPSNAEYTVENLQFDDQTSTYRYVEVGNWSSKNGLIVDENKIEWPKWFYVTDDYNKRKRATPPSVCHENCTAGYKVVGRSDCCWGCQKCEENSYTADQMQTNCTKCRPYYHSNDERTACIKTPTTWLEISTSAGLAIVIISSIGLILILISSVILIKLWKFVIVGDPQSYILTTSIALIYLSFGYGPMHIMEPTELACRFQNATFFILLIIYASLLLIKTKFMEKFFSKHIMNKKFPRSLFTSQALFMLLSVVAQLVSVIIWLYLDNVTFELKERENKKEYFIQCQVEFTPARLVTTFIPCILLIIATFCAFRERNMEHSFYEPKFLSFTCIALCIIILAFLPTFKYVVGEYRAIVMAFTLDVFGYTFTTCMILPKVYVAIVRSRKGKEAFPIKPAQSKKKKKKKDEIDNDRSRAISAADNTETSNLDISKVNGSKESVLERDDEIHFHPNKEDGKYHPNNLKTTGEGNENGHVLEEKKTQNEFTKL